MSSNQRINYRLVPTKTFLKDTEKLDKHTNQRIIRSLEDLPRDPFIGKPLRGELRGLYSLRVGEYRVIYSLDFQKHSFCTLQNTEARCTRSREYLHKLVFYQRYRNIEDSSLSYKGIVSVFHYSLSSSSFSRPRKLYLGSRESEPLRSLNTDSSDTSFGLRSNCNITRVTSYLGKYTWIFERRFFNELG